MDFALQVYIKDLKRISPLTMEEERRLFEKVIKGDSKARESIVTAYLPLVIKKPIRLLWKLSCRFN